MIRYDNYYRYTANVVYLFIHSFIMESLKSALVATTQTVAINETRTNTRKKTSSKQDDSEKITEKVEGGIIVRRYNGKKIEIEQKRE